METEKLPALPFDEWTETRITVQPPEKTIGGTLQSMLPLEALGPLASP